MLYDLEALFLVVGLLTALLGVWLGISENWQHERARKVGAAVSAAISGLSFCSLLLETRLDNQRETLVAEILETVQGTADLVEGIRERLQGVSLASVGRPLVSPRIEFEDAEALRNHPKGGARAWAKYGSWVEANRGKKLTALSFELNGSHRYAFGMAMAYLLTGSQSWHAIEPRLAQDIGAWIDAPFVDQALAHWQGVDYVLFLDAAAGGAPVAYAPARELARDLILRARVGGDDRVASAFESTLNTPQKPAELALLKLSKPAVRVQVVSGASVDAALQAMVANDWSECLALKDGESYLVSLAQLVAVAAAKSTKTSL